MSAKTILAAAALGAIAITGMSGTADAGRRHGGVHLHLGGHGHGHHHFRHHHRPHLYLGIGGGGCGYYREMWEDTGRFFWKRKYYVCKGWW